MPVTPFGAGSSLEGHVIPEHGGISLDLSRLDRILEIAPDDLSATVQAGVTRSALERAAGEHGLFFPVDPGADATLGGMAATNAAGTTTIRYGKMRANVLALEAVLADGTVVRTGSRAPKTSAGYDLTSLLVGSEGTLAVITELRVRLYGIPEHVCALRIAFPSVEAACRTAAALVAAGSALTRLELLDALDDPTRSTPTSAPTTPPGPCLLVEAAGAEATVEADLELVRDLAAAEGASDVVEERDAEGRARLWAARHAAAYASAAAAPGRHERATDTCVPVSELAGAVEFARAEAERLGLEAAVLGHAGDGNVHVSMQVDVDDPDELARSDELVERLVVDALARGGTSHGRARHRPRQAEGARARARRPPAADARHQAAVRPERHPQPRKGASDPLSNGLPIPRPGKIVCVGLNYRDHADESAMELPSAPLLFAKWPNGLIGPGQPIVLPHQTSEVDYEAELGVVIGKPARRVPAENALEHVAGYVCANDVSARDVQFADGQWTRGKSFDTFCPVGPMVPAAEIADPQNLRIRCLVNGEALQDGSTADMIFGVAELIAYISDGIELEEGDLVLTGTPPGVGFVRTPPIFLADGDEVTVEIEGVGSLTNPVRGA